MRDSQAGYGLSPNMDITLFSKEAHHFFVTHKHHQMIVANIHDMITPSSTTTTATCGSLSSDPTEPWTEMWAPRLLRECARAIAEKDSTKIHNLLWMLNELSSPYGDTDQKLASCFLQALFCKATGSGPRCYRTLTSVAEKSRSFDSARKLILKFQEVSPWTTFGHVASNGALLEALDGEANLHIIDISNTLCTQWPTLLEALATRNDDTPRMRLTVVDVTREAFAGGGTVMKEIGQRMEKFARLMGVPFEFGVVSGPISGRLTKEGLGIRQGEAVAVNCMGALRRAGFKERDAAVASLRSLDPKIVTIVEEEADFTAGDNNNSDAFIAQFEECLRFYTLYFEMLEESFLLTSNEKLMLERECSRGIVRVLACEDDGNDVEEVEEKIISKEEEWECERREIGKQWSERLRKAFSGAEYSDDIVDDVKALLKRYPRGWALVQTESGIHLTWKEHPVVWASAWKP